MVPTNTRMTTLIAISIGAVIAQLVIIGAVVYAVTRPSHDDFQTTRTTLVGRVATSQEKLVPAFNAYQRAFKQAQNETGSIEKAKQAAAKEQKAYDDAVADAHQAIDNLKKNRVANDSEAGVAVAQYVKASEDSIDYYTSLLNGYDEFDAVFATEEKLCYDVLVGQTSSMANRRDKLNQAVKDCYPALNRLKDSGNVTYLEYGKTIENRIKNLQNYAVAVAKGEADYKQFEIQQQALQNKAAALPADASEDEYEKVEAQIKDLSGKIRDSQSDFDSAAKRYKSTVEELPKLYGAVYTDEVPKQIKTFDKLVDVRKQTLLAILDDKLLDK